MIVFIIYFALFAAVGFACAQGDLPERLGGIWLLLNAGIHWLVQTFLNDAASLHVIIDGVYATGLLPLAAFYVSWWIGAQTFIAAAGFSLEAYYLLNDMPIDYPFIAISNVLFICGLLNLAIATGATVWRRSHSGGRLEAHAFG